MTPWVLPLSAKAARLEYYARFLDDQRLTSYCLCEKFDGWLCSQYKAGMETSW